MPDRLSSLLQRFELRARVLHGGALRGMADFDATPGAGHLHLLRGGMLMVTQRDGRRTRVEEPSALFCPRPLAHRLEPGHGGAEVVCAAVEFGAGDENPLLRGLPGLLVIPLAEVPALDATQSLLCAEAFGQRCGRAAVVDRLTEVLLVQLLRHAIERRLVDGGVLHGLADPRLARALTAMHASPARPWTLDALAATAGMSRSRFAAQFTQAVGLPAGAYLAQWRVGLAKNLLRRGRPVKQVALEVGYGGASTLGRAFAQAVGASPTQWLRQQGR
jgi:AraC-like DNA-binding protein